MCFMKSSVMPGRTSTNCCDSGLPCTFAPTPAPTSPPSTSAPTTLSPTPVPTPAPSSTPTYACTRPLSHEYEGGWCDCCFCCRVPNPLTDCYTAEWTPSFDNEGWSTCSAGYVMTKLRFNDLSGASAPALGSIEQVQCCRLPLATPAWPIQTTNVPNWWNWGTVLDAVNAWALCPTNEFIAGLNVRFPWRSRVAPSLASPGRLSVRSPGQRHGAASDAAPF